MGIHGSRADEDTAAGGAGPVTCAVCGAPALPERGACAFCLSPVAGTGDAEGLLDYVGRVIPRARTRRGLLGRGPVRRLVVVAGGERFTGRLRKSGLELAPEAAPAAWSARLAAALAEDAAADHELRQALARAGWALRRP